LNTPNPFPFDHVRRHSFASPAPSAPLPYVGGQPHARSTYDERIPEKAHCVCAARGNRSFNSLLKPTQSRAPASLDPQTHGQGRLVFFPDDASVSIPLTVLHFELCPTIVHFVQFRVLTDSPR